MRAILRGMNIMAIGDHGPAHTGPDLRLDDDVRWHAVLNRDRPSDGRFVYAVTSTGIYCRPSCPSRRPRRDRVRFFDAPDMARAAVTRAKSCGNPMAHGIFAGDSAGPWT